MQHQKIQVRTRGSGLYEITEEVAAAVSKSSDNVSLVTIFCRHTSCGLVLMENADPTARHDLENFFDHLVPDSHPHFQHTAEGPDDMPSHIKMALTRSSETIPCQDKRLLLGTWQGIFLWEFRRHPHTRNLIIALQS